MSPANDQPIDPERLAWPKEAEAASDSLEGNHYYDPDIRLALWENVTRALELEDIVLPRLRAAGDPAAEWIERSERVAVESSDIGDDFFARLDPGVASATLALGAIGCIPFWSCNGGAFGGDHLAHEPMVRFFARAEHVARLTACAVHANVRLSQLDGRCLLTAEDVEAMRAFASAILRTREA